MFNYPIGVTYVMESRCNLNFEDWDIHGPFQKINRSRQFWTLVTCEGNHPSMIGSEELFRFASVRTGPRLKLVGDEAFCENTGKKKYDVEKVVLTEHTIYYILRPL